MDANIELRIERLILDGVPACQRYEIVAALERAALARHQQVLDS